MTELYIGVMSGTSVDAIDCVLVDFASTKPGLLHTCSVSIPDDVRQQLLALTQSQAREIDALAQMDVRMGQLIAKACKRLIQEAQVTAAQINAIGSHGQTIRHYPQGYFPTSLQIGDANIIACQTGIVTIADFRRMDMAVGGQGAPLVPAFHRYCFAHPERYRCVLNIGGIANISILPPENQSMAVIGFDTGPGNALLDWCAREYFGRPYDDKGKYAARGSVNSGLLEKMLTDPYFTQKPPKSTGKEYFNSCWLRRFSIDTINKYDLLATLTELTATSISRQIKQNLPSDKPVDAVIVCGGGSRNAYLRKRLQSQLDPLTLVSSRQYGYDPQWIEAMAFAWLARQYLLRRPGNLPSVTGARKAVILGAQYLPVADQ